MDNLELKKKNIQEVEIHIKGVVSEMMSQVIGNYRLSIEHPTSMSVGVWKRSQRTNNTNDMLIYIHNKKLKDNLDTVGIAEKLSELGNFPEINNIFIKLFSLENVTTLSFGKKEFTIRDLNSIDKFGILKNNQYANILFLNLLMIGVNDNGRYRNYKKSNVGMINHLYTSYVAYLFFSKKAPQNLMDFLTSKNITNRESFNNWLSNFNIMTLDQFNLLKN